MFRVRVPRHGFCWGNHQRPVCRTCVRLIRLTLATKTYIFLVLQRGLGQRMSTRQVSAAEFKAKCLRIIQEMGSDGRSVTITRRGRPVAVLSPPPVEGEAPPFLGMMRGTVLVYEAPLAPAASPSDWAALR